MFSEWRAVDTAQSAASIFDITHDQEPTLENYCIALLEKVFTIPQSQLPEFITYQIQLNSDGTTWLNKFEKLLANNEVEKTVKLTTTFQSKLTTDFGAN